MQLPRFQNFSFGMRLSMFGAVALLVGVFVTVNNAMQNQENRSHASTVVTLRPLDDTYIDATTPSTIYGNGGILLANGNPQRVILMKFNLAGIPLGATITSASLKVTAGSNNGTSQTFPVYLMSANNWTEATTWNNRPVYTGTLVGNVGPIANGATSTVTLANAPLSGKAGQLVSFSILNPSTADGLGLESSESTTPPQLSITYTTTTATPTPAPTVKPTATPVPATATPKPSVVPTATSVPPTPTTAPAANIIPNPGCETNMTGLYGFNATIARTTSYHHTGIAACEVSYTSGTFYDIAVSKLVASPVQGSKYTGQAYVRMRSSGTNAGKKVYVAIREKGGANPDRVTYGSPILLSTTWQLVTNTMTVQSAGRTSLDYYVVQDGGPAAGDQFIVDDMSWSLNSVAPTPTPLPPTSTPKPTATNTPVPPTATPTVKPTNTPVPGTPTPFPTSLPTPTQQPTNTPAPTPTSVPGDTKLAMTLALHGIGNGGDSTNPTGQGNMTPMHSQRTATVEVYDTQNNLVKTAQGIVTYDAASGLFNGVINLGNGFVTGVYSVKVKTDQFLRELVPGIQSITASKQNQLPQATLVNGDINNDNAINILDYNILMGCFSELTAAPNCAPGDEVKADINDDGAVNSFDYNLFLRELTNRIGQ